MEVLEVCCVHCKRPADSSCLVQSYSESDEDDTEDLFRPAKAATGLAASDLSAIDAVDTSCQPVDPEQLQQWESAEAKESLRNRFVTGDLACVALICRASFPPLHRLCRASGNISGRTVGGDESGNIQPWSPEFLHMQMRIVDTIP